MYVYGEALTNQEEGTTAHKYITIPLTPLLPSKKTTEKRKQGGGRGPGEDTQGVVGHRAVLNAKKKFFFGQTFSLVGGYIFVLVGHRITL